MLLKTNQIIKLNNLTKKIIIKDEVGIIKFKEII
jgi:hypothetical protein